MPHYFDPDPNAAQSPVTIHVMLSGRRVELMTDSSVFARGRLDIGTGTLLSRVPPPPDGGHLLDLGCGYGPIAIAMAIAAANATVWAVDVNSRARELCRVNALAAGLSNVNVISPEALPVEIQLSCIWSNPPIRIGKTALHSMLRYWLSRLVPGGAAYLVVQRHLGADSLMQWLGSQQWEVTRIASRKGFRVMRVDALPWPESAIGAD
jgi:16S rRNA (guanine1207-N2)-methyltransferase